MSCFDALSDFFRLSKNFFTFALIEMYPGPLTTAMHIANEWPRQGAKLQTANTGLAAPQCRQSLPSTNMQNNNTPPMVLRQPASMVRAQKKAAPLTGSGH
ncbi:hypothetical protein ACLS0R_19005 [Comamonas jiangduensis]|uniref:hypothetical protein n=1 Tax=Comamonas jiangduensis TaxID=1194168 RepID=UPI003BF8ABC3